MPNDTYKHPIRIKIAEVERLCGVHRQTLWRWYSAGNFPKPHHLGRDRFWFREEIENWLEEKAAAA